MALLMMLCGTTWGQATMDVWTASEAGYGNGDAVTSVEIGGATVTFDKGTNTNAPKYYSTGEAVRVYGGGTFTVSCESADISSVWLTFGSGDGTNEITVDKGTYTVNAETDEGKWSNSEATHSVTFTVGGSTGHRRIASISVGLVYGSGPIVLPEKEVIYSWESPKGEPIETGGTIAYVNGDGNRLNYLQNETGYYTICLNGKKANLNDATASANAGKMVITLDKPLAAGDVIAISAFVYKDASKKASPYILFADGTNIEGKEYGDEANLHENFAGSITTTESTVTAKAGAGSSTITLTRSLTGTNLFITKLEVLREPGTEEPVVVTPAVPTFSLAAGEYTEPQTVELSCTTDGAAIMYTLDGTDPRNKKGMEYLEPITITETTTIKALAVLNGVESEVAEATYTITAAQEPEEPAGDYQWVLTAPEDLATGDVIAIVDQQEGKAMSNDNGTSMAPAAVAVTLSDDLSEITSDVAKNLQWQVTVAKDGLQFGADAENFLYAIDSNNGLRVGSNENNVFSVYTSTADDKSGEGITYLTIPTGEDTRYVGVYNAQDWRCYTSINNNIKNSITAFYKRVEKGEEPVELPEGTVYLWDAGKEAGGVAVATDGTSVGYANIVNSSTAAEVTYTTIRLNGNANYSIPEDNSRSNTTITLDQPLKAGDKISITAYRNKSAADKKSGARLKFDKGGELTTGEGLEFVNLDASDGSAADSNRGTEPNTIVVEVPQEADGSTVITLTRSYTSTNLFITKIEVTTEAEQPIVLPEDLAEALALLNQTIEDAIDVLADNVASTEAEDTFLDAIDEADALYRKGMSGKEGVTVDDVNEQITKLLAAIDAYKAAAEAYDPTTGISALSANDSRRQVYTIGGQRVSGQLQKGLYIINGRKVVIK